MFKFENRSFPRWSGPLVGAVVGVLGAWKVMAKEGGEISVEKFAYGAVIGACIGSLFLLIDKPQKEGEEPKDEATNLGRIFALMGLIGSLLPVLGLILAMVGVVLNWSKRGWPKTVSIIATVIGILSTAFLIYSLTLNGSD